MAALAGFFVSMAQAIDPNRAMSQYIRDRWTAEQGFPKGPVYAITQTADGYLWIGTEAGLVRFDGMNFYLMPGNPRFTPIAGALGLAPDNDGNLWVQLQGPMMVRYRDGVFDDPMGGLGFSNVTALCRTNQGGLLASAMEHGAMTYRHGKFEMLTDARALPRSPVISMAQTPSGDIWMGTRDAGLFRVRGGQSTAITKGLPDPKINCLLPDGETGLWVGTDDGIVRWDGSEIVRAGAAASLNRVQALAMARDRDGNIWVGTDSRGLVRVNSQGAAPLDEGRNGSGDAVTALFEDREGNLWSGSANGIERLRDSVFVTYSTAEGLPPKSNGPVYVDVQNRTWFAPAGGGLYWLSMGKVGRVTAAGLGEDVVYSIAGSGEDLWIGRQRGGLTNLRAAGSSFAAKSYMQADGLAQNSVFAVHQSRDRTVWAGTLSGGVSRLRNGKLTTYTTANGLASNTVSSILEGADGTMWFATPNGLSALAADGWRVYLMREGLPADSVNCLLEDSAGVLWTGTVNGLAFLRSGRFQVPAGGPESLKESILGFAEDKTGSLWIATANHVLRVNRDRLLAGDLHDGDAREYGLADGLHGIEGVKRHRSVVADSLDRIWFSMNRGLSVVAPARLGSASAPAIVHVQTISADGGTISINGNIRIPAFRQRIAFSFAGLSLSVPERIKFRYRLDGFDRSWSEPVSTRQAVFTNLRPGPYRFRVVASNAEGLWNSTEAAVAFEMDPMLWQTWWFLLSSVLACGLAVLGVYRFRLHQLTGRLNVRFEERLAERTRIAKELHDTLLQGFVGASMQLHVAAERLPDDSPAKPPVNLILELMGQVIEEGRNAVRGLRLTDNRPDDLARAFARIQEEFEDGENVDFRVVVEGQPRPLHPLVRDDVYRLGREALTNAFRHSRASRIEMELEYTRKRLRIFVRDNGSGIGSKALQEEREEHWGLPGMREQAEKIGARLNVWSRISAGTEVELSVPGHVAFGRGRSERLGRRLMGTYWRKDRVGTSQATDRED